MILRVPFGSRRSSFVHPPALGCLEIVQLLVDVPSNLHRDGSAFAGKPRQVFATRKRTAKLFDFPFIDPRFSISAKHS